MSGYQRTACVVGDDVDASGGTATYSTCGTPPGFTETLTNGCATYTPTGVIADTVNTCLVVCNNGKCDTTYVIIYPATPAENNSSADTVSVTLNCPLCATTVCPVIDDIDTTGGLTSISCGTPPGYSIAGPDSHGCFTYTPLTAPTDTVASCIIVCGNGACDTTYLFIRPASVPLHTSIVTFAGQTLPNGTNQLTWSANSGTDIESYLMERSIDQKNWTLLGATASKKYNGVQTYKLVDNNPEEKDFYRLSYKDKDGKVSMYPQLVYLTALSGLNDKVSVYPNPVNTVLTMEYNSISSHANVHVSITDIAGRTVKEFDKTFHTGKNTLDMDLNSLVDGTYLIHYFNAENGNNGTLKFIKDKE